MVAARLCNPATHIRCTTALSVVTQEEAVKTYTRALEDLDAGKLPQWSTEPVRKEGF